MDRLRALAVFRREPNDDREMPVAAGLIEIAGAVAADRDLDGGVDVARRQAVARRTRAVDIDLDGRLAERGEHRKIGDALHGAEHGFDLVGGVGQRLQIVAVELDRVLALDARDRLRDVVLQILREVEFDARELVLQLRQQLRGQFVLVAGAGPFAVGLQRREEFGVEQAGGVGAVVRAAVLRHHRFHFGTAADQSCASR